MSECRVYEVSPQTDEIPDEVSTEVVGLTKVTVVLAPSVTAFEYGLEESVPLTVIVFTVAVLQGSAITIVNSTLSEESAGENEVEPDEPLLATVIVFCKLTVYELTAARFPE